MIHDKSTHEHISILSTISIPSQSNDYHVSNEKKAVLVVYGIQGMKYPAMPSSVGIISKTMK